VTFHNDTFFWKYCVFPTSSFCSVRRLAYSVTFNLRLLQRKFLQKQSVQRFEIILSFFLRFKVGFDPNWDMLKWVSAETTKTTATSPWWASESKASESARAKAALQGEELQTQCFQLCFIGPFGDPARPNQSCMHLQEIDIEKIFYLSFSTNI